MDAGDRRSRLVYLQRKAAVVSHPFRDPMSAIDRAL